MSTTASLRIGFDIEDLHPTNGTIDDVMIFNRSLSAEQVLALYNNRTDLIVGQETAKGEIWFARVTPNDGTLDGIERQSNNVTILNTPPVVTLVAPSDGNTTTDRTPTFNWSGFDADGDSLTYDFNITLAASSTCSEADRFFSSLTDENLTLSSELLCLFDNGDHYDWTVRASDGVVNGSYATEFSINISALIQISLPVSVVEFGALGFFDTNDTSDDFPAPIVVQNDGNAFVNVTIEATSLWDTFDNPTDFYTYKVDNVSAENGSFNFGSSTTSFSNIPLFSSAEIAIVELNKTNATDSAEVDIFVDIPPDEVGGLKTSNVTFTASLAE